MIERYRDGIVPAGRDDALDAGAAADITAYRKAMDGANGYMLHDALKAAWQTIFRSNEFVDRQAPWKLAKDPANDAELNRTLGALVRELARQCVMLFPFMPAKCTELWQSLGAPGSLEDARFAELESIDPSGWRVTKGAPLFPKDQTKP